jgi:GntR family transcriptional regulator/MocR family aminotransferase
VTQTQANLAWEVLLDLSATRPGPLHTRLAAAIRSAIKAGRLPLGSALPPSRTLAADLGVSRWAVTQAYGQLVTEGYLAGRTGSATRVCWSPAPGDSPVARPVSPHRPVRYDLSQCHPDFRAFPRTRWLEALRIAAETAAFDQLGYPPEGGEPRLRTVLAEHLNRRRAAAVTPATISVFPGARAAMAQLAQALAAGGHTQLGVEDPGSSGLWQPARSAGLELVPLPVDGDGLVVGRLSAHPGLRAVSVGPAHNVATGCVLAPYRRSELLAWARRTGGLIVEDDYDSEFSYGAPPLPVMQGSDPVHVALLGSMSRTLTPSVNVGWVAAPQRLVAAVRAAPAAAPGPPALTQLALAHFLESGGYDRHLRACRQRFRARRNALLAALARELPGYPVQGAGVGLHLVLELPPGTDLAAVLAGAARHDMSLCDINDTTFEPDPAERRLQVGFGNLTDSLVGEAVTVLAGVIRDAAAAQERRGGRREDRQQLPCAAEPASRAASQETTSA